jgi:hypothetical protein
MAALLDRLQEEQRKDGPTPYLDTLLAIFAEQSKATHRRQLKRAKPHTRRSLLDD